jgi:hypothetical protein
MSTIPSAEPAAEQWLDVVRRKVSAMRFGSVQIVIHEGRVTQVESTEKTRLGDSASTNGTEPSRRK